MDLERLNLLKEIEGYTPPITCLSQDAIEQIYLQIIKKSCITREELVKGFLFQQLLYSEKNLPSLALSPGKETSIFERFLKQHKLIEQFVLLNYVYTPTQFDRIKLSELICNFSFYWYPSVDDLLILSENVSWSIGIRHDYAFFYFPQDD